MLNFTSAPKTLKENIVVYNIFILNIKKKRKKEEAFNPNFHAPSNRRILRNFI